MKRFRHKNCRSNFVIMDTQKEILIKLSEKWGRSQSEIVREALQTYFGLFGYRAIPEKKGVQR